MKFLEKATPYIYESGIVEILGNQYNLWVLQQEFEPRLPGFAGLTDGVLFISASTPKQYREYIFWHEVTCVVHRKRKNCMQTLKEELARVPKYMLREYIEYRFACFEALAEFYRNHHPPFYPEIVASRDYLRELLES